MPDSHAYSRFVKLRVAVPTSHTQAVCRAISKAGGARQGNYDHCFGISKQKGVFRPTQNAKPYTGKLGKLEAVDENVVEALCDLNVINKVIEAVRRAHPYEEPAIDVIPRLIHGDNAS